MVEPPIWKICSSNWIISPGRVEHAKCLKSPPSLPRIIPLYLWRYSMLVSSTVMEVENGCSWICRKVYYWRDKHVSMNHGRRVNNFPLRLPVFAVSLPCASCPPRGSDTFWAPHQLKYVEKSHSTGTSLSGKFQRGRRQQQQQQQGTIIHHTQQRSFRINTFQYNNSSYIKPHL